MVQLGFVTSSSRDCTGQKRKVVSLSYNSIEEQPPLVECPLACLLAWRCRTVVNKYWSISMTFLLVGGWVLFIKMTDKTPLIFVEYDERSIEHQAFTAQHILNKSLNKRKIMLKRENHEHHSFLSFLPSNLLCRAICWEFVEGISGWFS